MILLLGAMKEEIDAYLSYAENISEIRWHEFSEHTGTIDGKDVVIAKTGVGKALSALYTQHLIDIYHPKIILFSGLAGAIHPDYEIGDIVIADDCVQYDLDATELGFKRGEIPFTAFRFFKSDERLISLASAYHGKEFSIRRGRIMTGDRFVGAGNRGQLGTVFSELDGDAVEMEGASVALAAAVNNIPYLLIRAISDKADGNAPSSFADFVKNASMHMLDIIVCIIKQL